MNPKMVYSVKVYDDGDIFVTKLCQKPQFEIDLVFNDIERLKSELLSYGAHEIDKDINRINSAPINESVQCY